MATLFTALSAVVAHFFSKPEDTAPAVDRSSWWFEHADLLAQLRAKTEDPFSWERVQDLVEQAEREARRCAEVVLAASWSAHGDDGESQAVAS